MTTPYGCLLASTARRGDTGSLNNTRAGVDHTTHATEATAGTSSKSLVGAAVSHKCGNAGGQPGGSGRSRLEALQAVAANDDISCSPSNSWTSVSDLCSYAEGPKQDSIVTMARLLHVGNTVTLCYGSLNSR
jgi:hypothetical protein